MAKQVHIYTDARGVEAFVQGILIPKDGLKVSYELDVFKPHVQSGAIIHKVVDADSEEAKKATPPVSPKETESKPDPTDEVAKGAAQANSSKAGGTGQNSDSTTTKTGDESGKQNVNKGKGK